MINTFSKSFSKTLLAASIAGASTVTQAGSFGLIEQGASGQGSAYAGASAIGEDASTIYFNPAGMTRLSGSQILVAGHVVAVKGEYFDSGNSTTFAGSLLEGENSSSDEEGFIPNFYYSAELGNDVFAGLGVNVPFGLATDYDDGWIGRYHAMKSEITAININPSIAWKATDAVSVGFGINIQYIDIELTNNIDSFAACAGIEQQAGASFGCDYAIPGNAARDSAVKLDGDSLELGWNIGMLFDVDDTNRIGVAYRSAIKHEVSGDAQFDLDGTLDTVAGIATGAFGFNILQNTTLEATAEMPETFSLSYVHEAGAKWTLLADWTWTGWSSLDVITIRLDGGIPGQDPTLDLAYKDTSRYSIGVNYQHTDKLIYRAGLAYDQTPIRSVEQTTARIPGNDRKWLSLGVGYAPSASWGFDIGYSHLFISDTEINNGDPLNTSTSGATLIGTYESSVDILSVQANFNF